MWDEFQSLIDKVQHTKTDANGKFIGKEFQSLIDKVQQEVEKRWAARIAKGDKFQSLIDKVQQALMGTIMHKKEVLGTPYANRFRERSESGAFLRR